MSYILDALKKSEQKRREGTVPDLLTIHDQGHSKSGKHAWWRYVLIGMLILSIGTVPWLYRKYSIVPTVALPPDALVQPTLTKNSTQDTIGKGKHAQAPAEGHSRKKSPDTVRKTARRADAPFVDAPVSATHASSGEGQSHSKQVILKEHELPAAIKEEIPKLAISAHMYNATPSARIITIHGNIVHEGETVASGLRLERITPDGVILSYKGFSFYRPLFQ